MKPFWSPQSALIVPDLRTYATPSLLRMLLRPGGSLELLYAGDRMWPALQHGGTVAVEPLSEADALPGAAVIACPSGIPDLLRIAKRTGSTVQVQGDADPHECFSVPVEGLLARARIPRRGTREAARIGRRLSLEMREALEGSPDAGVDPEGTVRMKYESQAPFYAGLGDPSVSETLLSRLRERVVAGGPLLVAGSGTGRECFALANEGWSVTGVDFSPAMVDAAHRLARRMEPARDVKFLLADLTAHEEPAGSLAGIYFTADVYSFLPDASERVAMLKKMRRWLSPRGVVFLSARQIGRPYDLFVLTMQRAARGSERGGRWGDSHTRWIAPDGTFHRSFVHVFSERALRREIEQGGFRTELRIGSHRILVPA